MSSPAGNFVIGIVKQIVPVEDKEMGRGKKIIEKGGTYINRIGKIEPIVPEIYQTDPFFKKKNGIRTLIINFQIFIL